MAIILNDSAGNSWEIVIDDSGNVSAQATTKQSAPTSMGVNTATGYFHTDYPYKNNWNSYLAMNGYPGNSWNLEVSTAGVLSAVSITYSATWPLYLPVVTSPGGIVWRPYVDATGAVQSVRSWWDSPNTSSFGNTAGKLDPYSPFSSESSGKAVMPGPDTTVIDPDQFPEQYTGWFRAGDSRSLMAWELAPTVINGKQMVQVRNPQDGYVNNVYTPDEINAVPIVMG